MSPGVTPAYIPTPFISYAFAGIWLLLVAASVIVYTVAKRRPPGSSDELILRTRSWWLIAGLFTGAMLSSRPVALSFLGFISFLALKEFLSLVPTRREDRRVLFWAYLSIPFQYYWAGIAWYGMFIVFIPVYMFLFIVLRMLLTHRMDGFLKASGIIHWGLMTTVFFFSHTAYLLVLPASSANPSGGLGLLLFLVVLTQFNDVAQYVWGKRFGKHRITPTVSPKKTWEGFIGGVASTVALGWLAAAYLTPFDGLHAALAGLLIGVSGFFGDIIMSAVKRDMCVKDFSAMIPGHGGILDRIDSLIFTAPQFFYFTCYFYGY